MSDTAEKPSQRDVILARIEAIRTRDAEVELERDLSVNEWGDRIRGAFMAAQQAARAGVVTTEEEAWLDIAAIALGRLEVLATID